MMIEHLSNEPAAALIKELKGAAPGQSVGILKRWRATDPDRNLAGVVFNKLDLKSCDFSGMDMTACTFSGCRLEDARFVNACIRAVRFRDGKHGDSAITPTLHNAVFQGADACNGQFQMKDMRNCNFRRALVTDAVFSSDLDGSVFDEAKLNGTSLRGCNLVNATFTKANISYADLRQSQLNTSTRFVQMQDTTKCKIDRVSLLSLDPNERGLAVADIQAMDVADDQAALRLQFHGIARFAYWVSLLIFSAPYGWFVFEQSMKARFGDEPENGDWMPLYESTARFILRGGDDWQSSWMPRWTFLVFLGYLFYNVCRLLLLRKAVMLEAEEAITGVPPEFHFIKTRQKSNGTSVEEYTFWGRLRRARRYLFWFSVILVLLNTYHFMSMWVPLD